MGKTGIGYIPSTSWNESTNWKTNENMVVHWKIM